MGGAHSFAGRPEFKVALAGLPGSEDLTEVDGRGGGLNLFLLRYSWYLLLTVEQGVPPNTQLQHNRTSSKKSRTQKKNVSLYSINRGLFSNASFGKFSACCGCEYKGRK